MDRREQIWNRLASRKGSIESLRIAKSPVFQPGSLTFEQLTILTGFHGAGKSYALCLIDEALPGWQARWEVPPYGPRDDVTLCGEYEIRLSSAAGRSTEHVILPTTENYGRHRPVATAGLLSTILDVHTVISEIPGFESGVSPVRPPDQYQPIQAQIRAALGQIIGHEYAALEVANVEFDGGVFPLFRGSRDGFPITTWTMSSSEYWVSYILWILSGASAEDVVLIDEPETSLSSPGHRAFIDEIARLTLRAGCQTVIATHSEEIIRRTPPQMLRMVTRSAGASRFDRVSDTEVLLRSMRRSPPTVSVIILVEDATARAMVIAAVRQLAPSLLVSVDVVVAGGSAEVAAGVRIFRRSERVAVVGVLDGDATEGEPSGVWRLPGGMPELELAAAARSRANIVAERLDVTSIDVLTALGAARLTDHQRFFDSLALSLSTRDADAIRDVFVRNWSELPEHQPELQELVSAIESAHGKFR